MVFRLPTRADYSATDPSRNLDPFYPTFVVYLTTIDRRFLKFKEHYDNLVRLSVDGAFGVYLQETLAPLYFYK